MKKLLFATLLIIFSFNALYSQDVIYTINGKIDDLSTSLDSILVENLANNTRLSFNNLPDLPDYNINLTKQAFWGATGIHNPKELSAFSMHTNMPGLLGFACNTSDFPMVNISVYNTRGQMIYTAKNVRLNKNSLVDLHFGEPGLYLVKIKSDLGIQTFKGVGSANKGAPNVTMDIQNNTVPLYGFKSTKQTSTNDFSFQLGDSLRFSAYKNQYCTSPITIKISGSGTIDFVFKKDTTLFTDSRDGQIYKMVKIGNQVWMAENLRYLPSVSPDSVGSDDTICHYYVYGYQGTNVSEAKDSANYKTYGVLYNWSAAQKACPAGWHLPSDGEWKALEMAVGMSQSEADGEDWRGTDEGKKLKSTSGWYDNGNGTDSVGFSARPAGYRGTSGSFGSLGDYSYWWSATLDKGDSTWAWCRSIGYSTDKVFRYVDNNEDGYSVRCIRN